MHHRVREQSAGHPAVLGEPGSLPAVALADWIVVILCLVCTLAAGLIVVALIIEAWEARSWPSKGS